MLLTFDSEGPALEYIPGPLMAGPCAVSDIAAEEEEEAAGDTEACVAWTGEGTVRWVAEALCAGVGKVGRVPGAKRGLLFLLALGVTASVGALICRWSRFGTDLEDYCGESNVP